MKAKMSAVVSFRNPSSEEPLRLLAAGFSMYFGFTAPPSGFRFQP